MGWRPPSGTRSRPSVLAILEQPQFAAVFGPGSRAEQAICGTVGGRPVAGQIDRLVIAPDEVLLVDYKTNRHPPAAIEATPGAYLRQLAAYGALLRQLYPGRRVVAALLWTRAPVSISSPCAARPLHPRGSLDAPRMANLLSLPTYAEATTPWQTPESRS